MIIDPKYILEIWEYPGPSLEYSIAKLALWSWIFSHFFMYLFCMEFRLSSSVSVSGCVLDK